MVRTGAPLRYDVAENLFEDISKWAKWHEPLRVYIQDQDFGPAENWSGGKPAIPVEPGGNSKDDRVL